MRSIATIALVVLGLSATAQTTITNGGFENWGGNASPGIAAEPTNWYSNQSGSGLASSGGQTCFKDVTIFHSGASAVRVETISGPLSTVVNGNVTTGVVNAPSLSKSDGYIATINHSTATDIRRMSFTGKPDSLVGWYQYFSGGGAEIGKVRAILHVGNYYDPETATSYHPDSSVNKIADALFNTPTGSNSTWTRFSVPFNYVSGSAASSAAPVYIMINITSSDNQNTTVAGSKLWIDDLEAVYVPVPGVCDTTTMLAVSAVTNTTATLSWTSASGSAGSEYVISTTAGTPTGSGTATTASTYNATALTPSTTYYASVRDSCDATHTSAWTTRSFTTSAHGTGVTAVNGNVFAITAFPNPVKDEVTVKIEGATVTNGKVQLIDMSGRVISNVVTNTASAMISTNGLASGVYMIRYTDAAHTQTVMIEKQ